jgi:transposase
MKPENDRIALTHNERSELQRQAGTGGGRGDAARRARLILLLADGLTWAEVRRELGCGDSYISRWSKRFAADRLAGLFARYRGGPRHKVPEDLEARVLAWTTQRKPADGSTHWSSRKLAAALGGELSHMTVVRIWARHGLRPHEPQGDPLADDAGFEAESADVVGLYLNPPQHAVVLAVDDTGEVRAPERKASVTDGSGAMGSRRGLGRSHPGTLSLYEVIGSAAGTAPSREAQRHTSAELAAFLTDVVVNQPVGRELHVIADQPSAYRARRVSDLLAAHGRVHLHFLPTHADWLHRIESWLARIERDLVARGALPPAPDLKRTLMRYIRHKDSRAEAVKWKHYDPSHRNTAGPNVPAHRGG